MLILFYDLMLSVLLQSYASILYLRIPPGFRIILRGKDVEHHNIVNDMMLSQEITYKPQHGADGVPIDSNVIHRISFTIFLSLIISILNCIFFVTVDNRWQLL